MFHLISQYLIYSKPVKRVYFRAKKKLLICFSGTAASAKLSQHQTFLSLFSRNFFYLIIIGFLFYELNVNKRFDDSD